jgi:CRISPR/Cas system-associated protein Csx1
MLVGVVGLFESQRRFEMFKAHEFEIMYLNKRVAYFQNYTDKKPSLNPPFSSVYVCHGILPQPVVFEEIKKG